LFKEHISKLFLEFQHAVDLSLAAFKAPKFIQDHKLWKGFFDHKWVSLYSLIFAVVFSHIVIDNLRSDDSSNEKTALVLDLQDEEEFIKDDEDFNKESYDNDNSKVSKKGKLNEKIKEEGGTFFFSGGMKYLLLIFLEVLIFHFSVKTYSILKGKKVVLKFKDFYHAEVRMLTVMLQSMIKTALALFAVNILFGILGLKFLKAPVMFLVYAYFIGHAFLDNYNEQHNISTKVSDKIISQRIGASTMLGIIASVIMLIPIIGPLTAPLLCSVIATLYGYSNKLEEVRPLA